MAIGMSRSPDKLRYIYPGDPALDKDNAAFDWDAFFRTGDAKYAPLKDGLQPTWFQLRRLTPKQFRHVMRQDAEFDKCYEAVAYGLVGVDGFLGADGREVTWKPPRRTDLGERASDETLAELFAVELFRELGLRVITLSTLDP